MADYILEAGRTIYRNGKPFIAIMRCGDTDPGDADNAFRLIGAKVFHCDYGGPITDPLATAIQKLDAAARLDDYKTLLDHLGQVRALLTQAQDQGN